MSNSKNVHVLETNVKVIEVDRDIYISLTDIARHKDSERSDYILQNWMRNRSTIEFIGLWEQIHNPGFKSIEFDGFKNDAGSNSFSMTPKRWIESTNAIGIISKKGRYGGSFAHQDIAFEFASWISAEFKLYLLKEFQRLKQDEFSRENLEWNVSRTLAKVNYQIHTDAVKNHLIPEDLSLRKQGFVYASEADLLNTALFGQTAKQWRDANPELKGNIRDAATLEQLVVLSNMESFNSELLKQNLPADERVVILNRLAIDQMRILISNKDVKKLTQSLAGGKAND
ncbi:MAG: KilA-N domain-containing protein [Victivallaceae bacterium]|nr:KilA-N domain-containing protein [Victivallaceae bacterium]